ncbi:uncharacterized protein LOC135120009 [Zophobas morio]|uniref:uncharacterized protein LOC135120009 n=1 Tax=Zophobas morio TaxID=2755281 RepID=UPI003083DC76
MSVLSGNPIYFKHRKSLPIFFSREKILNFFKNNKTFILVGETGSGKTTQLVQYLLDSELCNKVIACTQPRRVAAITVARRVAKERGVRLGMEVGYTVRFQDVSSSKTRIKYLTDGMLLREAVANPLLKKYEVIILDEAHERTLHTDVLFSIVKDLQTKREDLKVIIMSATLDVSKFSKYFNNCETLHVSGRQYPVEILYCKEPENDYVDATLITVLQIHLEELPGDILCFLTGQEEIEAVLQSLEEKILYLPESG